MCDDDVSTSCALIGGILLQERFRDEVGCEGWRAGWARGILFAGQLRCLGRECRVGVTENKAESI